MSLRPKLPGWSDHWALFLDLDGTLIEIHSHPDEVRASPRLRSLLAAVTGVLDGALALVSGRSIAGIDRVVEPLVLPAAGLHGLERRSADGRVHYPAGFAARLATAREELIAFVEARRGLLLEDKGAALALHYRNAPEHEAECRQRIEAARAIAGDDFHVQQGKMVLELKPSGQDKGTAIAAFMGESPFRGRQPVFVGDDLTDEDGFRVVNALGGLTIRVGTDRSSHAAHAAAAVADVLDWLEQYREITGAHTA